MKHLGRSEMAISVLVTGGAGFIGSNFVPYFCRKYPNYHLIVLDKLTYAGNLDNLHECQGLINYTFIQGDICDPVLMGNLFHSFDIRGVIHFAAESHVDNSINDPRSFIDTNIVGTFNLLQAAYNYWMEAPHKIRPGFENCRFHHISTDEVYGSLGKEGVFTELSKYAPNSPYSASKASSDLMVRSYFKTYGLNVTTSNCSNNFGPKQHVEKLIPKTIHNCLNLKEIPIYGSGNNIRDWIYVLDHCEAIDLIFHKGQAGEVYNVGSNNELDNLSVVQSICQYMDYLCPRSDGGKYESLITHVADRAGHDFRYAIDSAKIKNELGWEPKYTFEKALKSTVFWYIKN